MEGFSEYEISLGFDDNGNLDLDCEDGGYPEPGSGRRSSFLSPVVITLQAVQQFFGQGKQLFVKPEDFNLSSDDWEQLLEPFSEENPACFKDEMRAERIKYHAVFGDRALKQILFQTVSLLYDSFDDDTANELEFHHLQWVVDGLVTNKIASIIFAHWARSRGPIFRAHNVPVLRAGDQLLEHKIHDEKKREHLLGTLLEAIIYRIHLAFEANWTGEHRQDSLSATYHPTVEGVIGGLFCPLVIAAMDANLAHRELPAVAPKRRPESFWFQNSNFEDQSVFFFPSLE